MSLNEEGFLSKEMTSVTEKIKRKYSEYFSLYEELNVFAQDTVFLIEVNNLNAQQIILASVYLRLLSSYQSIYLLCEKGLVAESKIILRSIFENVFKFVAIVKDKELAKTFIKQDMIHQKKSINKLFESDPSLKSVKELKEIIEENKKKKGEKKPKELGPKDYAQKADLMNYYNTAYSLLCSSAHTEARELEKLLVADNELRITSFKWGPVDEEVDFILLGSMEAIMIVLKNMNEIFVVINEQRYLKLYRNYEILKEKILSKYKNT